MIIQSLDERRNFIIPGDKEETIRFCAEHLVQAYQESVQQKDSFYIALSGGSTPAALFRILTQEPYNQLFDWKKVHLFWSDERSVPPNHPDSNYHMAMISGFASVGIPEKNIHRMIAEKNLETNATAYEQQIQKELQGTGFDYLCLGMGEDGHTASLFPGTQALSVDDKLVTANEVPQKNTWRMTMTFPCINAAKRIVLYVLGDSKKEKVQEIFLNKKGVYPVERVGSFTNKALWVLDKAAASLLSFQGK